MSGLVTARKLITAPAVEPITLLEVKQHLRMDSVSFAEDLTAEQTVKPGSHDAGTVNGDSVEVLGYSTLVLLNAGTCGSSGTVDVKLQHRNTGTAAWEDVPSGSFTQVTEANDDQIFEMAYTEGLRYLRAVAVVETAACEFGVTVLNDSPYSSENDTLNALIVTAREACEVFTNRALITQTWEYYLSEFPSHSDAIQIPLPPLQSIESFKYKDCNGDETVLVKDTDFHEDIVSYRGRIVLPYGGSWPSATLWPVHPITIQFKAGYGDAETDVPEKYRSGMKMLVADWFENKGNLNIGNIVNELPWTIETLWGFEPVSS